MVFDVVIIGSGPGGYVAAVRAAQLGFKTAVIERAQLGGICLNWGCIPTKALLKSADALNTARNAATYGIKTDGNFEPDIHQIVARSRAVSAQMSKGIEFLFKKHNVTLIPGRGKIAAPGVVVVGEDRIESSRIIIATGARSNSLPMAPIDGKKIIGYRQALMPERIPATMAIIGSGAIGSEMAYFYTSMGTKVTLIEYLEQIVPTEDEEVAAQLSRSFRKLGMKVMPGAKVVSAEKHPDRVILKVETRKGAEAVEAELVLSAAGVIPNTNDLGLEETGIKTDRGYIIVDESYMTSVPGIYAIGDVLRTPALAHVASAEAISCVEQMAGLNVPRVNYSSIPGCIYAAPEIASVGLRERDAKAKGLDIRIGKFPFTASGKAAAAGERDGFIKLIFLADSGELLGAHMIGAHATEMIGGMVALLNKKVTAREIMHSVFPHPTMSEGIMEAAAMALGEAVNI